MERLDGLEEAAGVAGQADKRTVPVTVREKESQQAACMMVANESLGGRWANGPSPVRGEWSNRNRLVDLAQHDLQN
jgi:hypothetical protein